MLKLLNKARESEGLKQTTVTVFGNVFATGMAAVSLILISRLLGPSQFGEFSVGISIVLILSRINDLGLNATQTKFIPKFKNNSCEINQSFGYTLKIKLLFSFVIFLVGLIFSQKIAELLNVHNPALIYSAFFLSVCTTWYEQLLTLLQALHRFNQAVLANAIQAIFKLFGALFFFTTNLQNNLPIFVFYSFVPVAPVLLSKLLLPKWFKPNLNEINKKNQLQIWNMAKFSSIGFITAGLVANVDVLFVKHYLDSYETGLLAGVTRIASMILIIAFSLSSVLNARVSKYQTKEDLSIYIRKSFLFLILVGAGFLLFLPFSKLLILLTIGPEYISGITIMYILTASAFITIASVPFLALFYSLKADWYFLFAGIFQTVVVILGNFLFVPHFGILASALTKLAISSTLFIITTGLGLLLYAKEYHKKTSFFQTILHKK